MKEKEHEGELAPALPPAKGQPDPLPPKMRLMLNQVIDQVRLIQKDDHRKRRIVAFDERPYKTIGANGLTARPVSRVRVNDRPEIEHYLKRRDIVQRITADIALIREKLAQASREEADFMKNLAWLTARLANLEEDLLKHMTAMEDILASLSRENMDRLKLVTKLAADGAKLTQAAAQHQDKMEIARKATMEPTTDDLLAKVAAKHGLTVEQARLILGAKDADLPPEPQ
jgi:DNA anti-recombination protein RmuC